LCLGVLEGLLSVLNVFELNFGSVDKSSEK